MTTGSYVLQPSGALSPERGKRSGPSILDNLVKRQFGNVKHRHVDLMGQPATRVVGQIKDAENRVRGRFRWGILLLPVAPDIMRGMRAQMEQDDMRVVGGHPVDLPACDIGRRKERNGRRCTTGRRDQPGAVAGETRFWQVDVLFPDEGHSCRPLEICQSPGAQRGRFIRRPDVFRPAALVQCGTPRLSAALRLVRMRPVNVIFANPEMEHRVATASPGFPAPAVVAGSSKQAGA
jgi:hypothetical protein